VKRKEMKLSVVGLGKLGLCTAAYFASKGHRVTGVDKSSYLVGELGQKRCPIRETGLAELLETAWDNLSVTTEIADGVRHSDITLVIVPTPSGPDGGFSNEHVEAVLHGIGPVLASKGEFHVVDVVSTVMPGSSEGVFKPLLEELSGKVCGEDFGLVYNPEFIALGSVIDDFSRPDMVLIGASDERSAEMVEQLYLSSCENRPHIAKMSLLNAEIGKLSLNCFVTTKISFANELSNICERIPGADVDAITEAIGFDSRVGGKYLRAGMGFGGTCFPRDNAAFQTFAMNAGYEARISRATVAVNDMVVERLYGLVRAYAPDAANVALLGLSYKQGTHVIEESQSIMLANRLIDAGYSVNVHDPAALEDAAEALGPAVEYCSDPYECVRGADAIVLLTRWPAFKELDWERIESSAKDGCLLLDSWRELASRKFTKFNYVGLGLGAYVKCLPTV
jgi:UDPglucose 6-dehydrogenase